MAGKIFINYRREDAKDAAARVHHELVGPFSAKSLFMDVDNLLAGQRFDKELEKALAACDVFLAVIGPYWLKILDERRISVERDYVREEIAAALQRGIHVIPLLVGGARLPKERELPVDIAGLVMHQKHELRHEHFGRDVGPLIEAIKALQRPKRAMPWKRVAASAVGVVSAVAITITLLPHLVLVMSRNAEVAKPRNGIFYDLIEAAAKDRIAALEAPGSGKSLRDPGCPGGCPEMVVVPKGEFLMGSPDSEEGHSNIESRQHKVTISNPFIVGKYEITLKQFEEFAKDTENNVGFVFSSACFQFQSYNNWTSKFGAVLMPGHLQSVKHPAVCISFDDATAYAAWLGKVTGKSYRLLTEAEWEYAARASDVATPRPRFPFGNDASELCGYANGADITAKAGAPNWPGTANCIDGYFYTAPVGSFRPNAFGLNDMLGNVWEWVQDCYVDNFDNAPEDGSARQEPSPRCARVVRGGSWADGPERLRSASRSGYISGSRYDLLGFRVARSL